MLHCWHTGSKAGWSGLWSACNAPHQNHSRGMLYTCLCSSTKSTYYYLWYLQHPPEALLESTEVLKFPVDSSALRKYILKQCHERSHSTLRYVCVCIYVLTYMYTWYHMTHLSAELWNPSNYASASVYCDHSTALQYNLSPYFPPSFSPAVLHIFLLQCICSYPKNILCDVNIVQTN